MSEDDELGDGGYQEVERRGSQMAEIESYERVIEGLKKAADGCRHMAAHRHGDLWKAAANVLDMVRNKVVDLSGLGRHNDGVSGLILPIYRPLMEHEAFPRIHDGIRQAAGGTRQLAIYHRMDPRWLAIEKSLLDIRDKTTAIARRPRFNLQPGILQ